MFYCNSDGKLYTGDLQVNDRLATDDEVLSFFKENKITTLKNNCINHIYSVYPLYRQVDINSLILGFTENDRLTMNEFISNQVNRCRNLEQEIKACSNLEELSLIDINYGVI